MKLIYENIFLQVILISLLLAGCDSAQQQNAGGKTDRVQLGQNEHEKDFGPYTVHVNAFTTDQLTADVAKNYNISRSHKRAMLNVAIKKNVSGEIKSLAGKVSTSTRNMANQLKDMDMQEITEENAIYYIGTTSVDNEETLIFDINVTPVNETKTYLLSYKQQFFTK